MAKLWDKGQQINHLFEQFSVGDDYLLDKQLLQADCLASIAHVRTLENAELLSAAEATQLEQGLCSIIEQDRKGLFTIQLEAEDGHTAIENFLVNQLGVVGKKVHTGRSRNDQVLSALRLWMREFSVILAVKSLELASSLLALAQEHEWTAMPGRTHMQLAMPSSVGLWATSFSEALLDQSRSLVALNTILDQSPLGSAASYGTALPLDRHFSSSQMGFAKVQNNVLYANNSRGLFEAMLLDQCDYIALILSKLAQDLLLFSLPELGYFTLPESLTTGSSIMPQKRNPDGLELIRSRSALISSSAQQVKMIIRALPSGYNRDFQDTKGPLLTGCRTTLQMVELSRTLIESLQVNPEALLAGCRAELYATDEVFNRLAEGKPFRELYQEVSKNLAAVEQPDPVETLKKRTSVGTAGNLQLAQITAEVETLRQTGERLLTEYLATYQQLASCATYLV